jgi:hypothetical protein
MPNEDDLEVKVMEYGDMSSLVVEYPDYNSFGLPMITLGKTKGNGFYSTEYIRFHEQLTLPSGL